MPWFPTPLNDEPFAYSPAVTSWGLSRLDVFGISSRDGGVRHALYDGQNWSPWENLGGVSTAGPAACSWGPARLDVFLRGENGSLVWKYYDISRGGWFEWWLGPPDSESVLASAPAAASWGPGRWDVFALGTDGNMWQFAGEPLDGVYSGWVNIGAPNPGFKDAPAVTSWRINRLDIVVCGRDDSCYYKVYEGNNGGWTAGWQGLGGTLSSGPAITSNPNPTRLHIFARAPDGELEHWCPETGPWENLGNQFVGQPAAASWGPGRLDAFVVNINGELWWWWSEG